MPTVLRAKCVVIGNSGVGKSCLCQVFHNDCSPSQKTYLMTTSVEVSVKSVNIPDTDDQVELYLFDSAGKETFSENIVNIWNNASVVAVVYDVTDESSFLCCDKWIDQLNSVNESITRPGVLIANKSDLDQRRAVSVMDGREKALSKGLEYFECSAKEIQNVDAAFSYLAQQFHRMYKDKIQSFSSLV